MKARTVFDTLAYANRLKAAGVESNIAEVYAEINADMMEGLIENTLATKKDINDLRAELHSEVRNLETRLTLRMGGITTVGVTVILTFMSILHIVH